MLTGDHPPLVGGVAVFTARVVAELARRGHRVDVVARGRQGDDRAEVITGSRLRRVDGPAFARWGGLWLTARGARALARADRVLATTWPAATALARLGVPFDVVAHGSDVTRDPRDPAAFRRVWGAAGRRFAMSASLADGLRARGIDGPVGVLPAPVPLAPHPGCELGGAWVCVARATPLKGGDRFVRLVAAAGARGVVVGDGPALGGWRALAASLGADVSFTGSLPPDAALGVIRGASAVFLVPRSDPDGAGAEGLGFALIEAAAAGVPPIGCATGGVPEAVGPGLVLADPDDVGASVAAIRAYLADPDAGARAWAWARDRHGVARTVDALTASGSAAAR